MDIFNLLIIFCWTLKCCHLNSLSQCFFCYFVENGIATEVWNHNHHMFWASEPSRDVIYNVIVKDYLTWGQSVSDLMDTNHLTNDEMCWKSYKRIADKTATHRLNTEWVLLFFCVQVQISDKFCPSNTPRFDLVAAFYTSEGK